MGGNVVKANGCEQMKFARILSPNGSSQSKKIE
jgi:hypothetical protein